MNPIIQFLSNNADKFFTLLATIVGAVISYIVTTRAEQGREKRALQREKLKDVLIPYCTSLEDAIEAFDKCNKTYSCDLSDAVKRPLEYLKAEKRVYLDQKQREDLTEYKKVLNYFYNQWEYDVKTINRDYKSWLAEELSKSDIIGPAESGLDIFFSSKADEKIRRSVLKKRKCNLLSLLDSVQFVHNDDDPCHVEPTNIDLGIEARAAFDSIVYGENSIEDYDSDLQLSIQLMEFIKDNMDDSNIVEELITKTTTHGKMINARNKAEEIKVSLIKSIDRIIQ